MLKNFSGENGSGRSLKDAIIAVASDYDVAFLVGGMLALGIGLTYTSLPFVSWIATTCESENSIKSVFSLKNLVRKFRYFWDKKSILREERAVLKRSKQVWAISSFTKGELVKSYSKFGSKISCLPIPVPLHSSSLNSSPVLGRVLFCGRFSDPRKDIKTLFQAVKLVRKNNPDIELILAGDTPHPSLVSYVRSLTISDIVTFKGKLKSLDDEYRIADVVVIPSLQEGLCLLGLEAMSYGVPVVSTRCGGPEEYIKDGKTGLLVPVGDVKSLAVAIQTLVEDREKRNRIGIAGRKMVREGYGEDEIFSSIIREINSLPGFR